MGGTKRQLWKSFDSFRGASELDTWVYRVALNTAINFMPAVTTARSW